ncbi:hypothetical protein [Natronosalvus amylolyticus]|uniref:hypothetical protein n=1 Tax=Natronosalvus amylolyticus TaxID=2961994 RepID=UPI0020C9A913|nr:hypothetical protein [Natronosalvus amylolyticus]
MSWEEFDDPPYWLEKLYEKDGWMVKELEDHLIAKRETFVYKIEIGCTPTPTTYPHA